MLASLLRRHRPYPHQRNRHRVVRDQPDRSPTASGARRKRCRGRSISAADARAEAHRLAQARRFGAARSTYPAGHGADHGRADRRNPRSCRSFASGWLPAPAGWLRSRSCLFASRSSVRRRGLRGAARARSPNRCRTTSARPWLRSATRARTSTRPGDRVGTSAINRARGQERACRSRIALLHPSALVQAGLFDTQSVEAEAGGRRTSGVTDRGERRADASARSRLHSPSRARSGARDAAHPMLTGLSGSLVTRYFAERLLPQEFAGRLGEATLATAEQHVRTLVADAGIPAWAGVEQPIDLGCGCRAARRAAGLCCSRTWQSTMPAFATHR